LLLVRVELSAGRAASRLLGCTGELPFHTVLTALDLMGMDSLMAMDSTISRSSLRSSRRLHQPPQLAFRPKTESTFSHTGWTVGMGCRYYSQDTGPLRRKLQSIDPLNLTAVSPNGRTKRPQLIHTTPAKTLGTINATNLKKAHALIETGRKLVLKATGSGAISLHASATAPTSTSVPYMSKTTPLTRNPAITLTSSLPVCFLILIVFLLNTSSSSPRRRPQEV